MHTRGTPQEYLEVISSCIECDSIYNPQCTGKVRMHACASQSVPLTTLYGHRYITWSGHECAVGHLRDELAGRAKREPRDRAIVSLLITWLWAISWPRWNWRHVFLTWHTHTLVPVSANNGVRGIFCFLLFSSFSFFLLGWRVHIWKSTDPLAWFNIWTR